MALIDMLTDIKSFNYDSVGKQHLGAKGGKDYFGDEHATGFTPNRERPNPSEFVGVSQTKFKQTGEMYGMSGVSFPGPLNWFDKNSVHQAGYTLYRTIDNLPSEFIGVDKEKFTQTGTKYEMGNYNFEGQYKSGLSFIPDIHATGFVSHVSIGDPSIIGGMADVSTHYKIGSGNVFNYPNIHKVRPVVNYFDIGQGEAAIKAAVASGIHSTGFTADRILERLPSEFIGVDGEKFTQTGTKYEMGDYNFEGQSIKGLSFIPDIHAIGFVSNVSIGDPSIVGGMGEVKSHFILGSGNDFNYPLDHSTRPVINYFDRKNKHSTGFTADRILERIPSEFIGIEDTEMTTGWDGFTQTGAKYEVGGRNFTGQYIFGNSWIEDSHAVGFTTHRFHGDLESGPGIGDGAIGGGTFHTVAAGEHAGQYIIGSGNDFNYPATFNSDILRPVVNYFDIVKLHSTGFTANRILARLPSEFVGIDVGGAIAHDQVRGETFENTGMNWQVDGKRFKGQYKFGNSWIKDTNATGFTTHRDTQDLGPGIGMPGFHTVPTGGTAGEYIIGSGNDFNYPATFTGDSSRPAENYFDINKFFSSGPFVTDMLKLYNEFADYSDLSLALHDNQSDLESLPVTKMTLFTYGRLISARTSGGGQATNKPKKTDFGDSAENTIDGEEGKFNTELRLIDLKTKAESLYSRGHLHLGGNKQGLKFGPGTDHYLSLSDNHRHPFIIKEIGERYKYLEFAIGTGFTDIPFQLERTKEDIERLASWSITPYGIVWTLKQFLLQAFTAKKSAKVYNPLGLLGSIVPIVHMPRHTRGTFLDVNDPPSYPDNDKLLFGKDDSIPRDDSSDGHDKTYSQQVIQNSGLTQDPLPKGGFFGNLFGLTTQDKAKTEQPASTFNLGTGKVKAAGSKLYSVGVSNQLQVPYGGKFDDKEWAVGYADHKLPKDFIKFKIRDVVNGKWLIFPAHLGTITDTVTPNWTPEKYIGRPDSVHLYSGTDRSVSFDFKVAAFTKQEIPIIQEKMSYLMGLGYPTYKKILDTDDEARPVAPYIELTIGDLFNATPGYFSSITITMEETATWELDDGFQIPQFFSVGVEFVHIGKYLPTTLSKHYEVPWLEPTSGNTPGKFGTFGIYDPTITNNVRPSINKKTLIPKSLADAV